MKKVLDLLLFGGISPEKLKAITSDIDESNRKSVISYSLISLLGFIGVYFYAVMGDNAVTRNVKSYLIGIVVMIILIVLNMTAAKKKTVITRVSSFLFTIVILGIGIMLAVSSKEDVTASYMVFLFVAPLLFTIRPIHIDLVILGSDITYILLMQQIQTPDVFRKNIVNAIIYGILSAFVCTTMTRMRMQKFETDHMNRILMETDQLTGMLNRRSFDQHINKLKSEGSVTGIKVCAFDVNGLKKVNDHIGHHAGDELLQGAAACLKNVFSQYGNCYRVGGDEFLAILQSPSPSIDELMTMLNDQTIGFKGTYVPGLSISAGIVEGTEQESIDSLLRRADAKMYESKTKYYQSFGKLSAR